MKIPRQLNCLGETAGSKNQKLYTIPAVAAADGIVPCVLASIRTSSLFVSHMVIDLHSHGLLGAFFSSTDNFDDRSEVKIAGVIGNLNKPEVTTSFRLCANGVFVSLPFESSQEQKGYT